MAKMALAPLAREECSGLRWLLLLPLLLPLLSLASTTDSGTEAVGAVTLVTDRPDVWPCLRVPHGRLGP